MFLPFHLSHPLVLKNIFFICRVQLTSQRTPTDINRASEVGLQVHCAITSSFAMNEIVLPTEQVLFKYFLRFGTISDVQVNNYSVREVSNQLLPKLVSKMCSYSDSFCI